MSASIANNLHSLFGNIAGLLNARPKPSAPAATTKGGSWKIFGSDPTLTFGSIQNALRGLHSGSTLGEPGLSGAVSNPLVNLAGEPSNNILALSGGGWNSHSILAGLVSGAMQASGQTLDTLLQNFGTVAANSGGTWFLSHLAYSDSFADSLLQVSTNNGIDSYAYNEQLRSLFSEQSLVSPDAQKYLDNLLKSVGINSDTAKALSLDGPYLAGLLWNNRELNWADFVDKMVYGPAVLGGSHLRDINLDSPRLGWATNKDLVYALAVASNPAVISDRGLLTMNEKIFSSIEPSSVPQPSSWSAYQKENKKNLSSLPLLVNSDFDSNSGKTLGLAEFPFGEATITFKNNPLLWKKEIHKPIGQNFATPNFNLIDTTTASSATYGLFASPDTFTNSAPANTSGFDLRNGAASILRQIAPLASFKSGILSAHQESDADSKDIGQIADAELTRLVDGGYVDNTAVAYAIRHLQKSNGIDSPFKVTLLMNSSLDPVTGLATFSNARGDKFSLPGSAMLLFGLDYSGKPVSNQAVLYDSWSPLFTPYNPSPQTFDLGAWDSITGPTWTYRADNGTFGIDIYSLEVETVDNEVMGIQAGQKGVLNIIATNNSQSAAGPLKPGILDEYDQNFTFSRDALTQSGGWDVIKDFLTMG